MNETLDKAGWKVNKSNIFWAEIAPCDHVLQIYENEENFIQVLAGFVRGGIDSGDGVIIIATDAHLKGLEHQLMNDGMDVSSFLNTKYFPLNAEETLSRFMVNNWPDEELFMNLVTGLIRKVRGNNRKVRAFGEMVALLWAQGHNGATVHLEHLWNKFCQNEVFCLFCAYPKSGFTENINVSIQHICAEHSKMIAPTQTKGADVMYRRMRL